MIKTTVEFDDFFVAVDCVRKISQSGLMPVNCRIVSPFEAFFMGATKTFGKTVLLLGFESFCDTNPTTVHNLLKNQMDLCIDLCEPHGNVLTPKSKKSKKT
eukprot:UN01705